MTSRHVTLVKVLAHRRVSTLIMNYATVGFTSGAAQTSDEYLLHCATGFRDAVL